MPEPSRRETGGAAQNWVGSCGERCRVKYVAVSLDSEGPASAADTQFPGIDALASWHYNQLTSSDVTNSYHRPA